MELNLITINDRVVVIHRHTHAYTENTEEDEIFNPIIGYEGDYEVTSLENIVSLKFNKKKTSSRLFLLISSRLFSSLLFSINQSPHRRF